MRRAFGTAAAALVLLALLPVTVQAQRRVGGPQHRVSGQHPPQHPRVHQRFHHRPFGSRLVVVAPFVPFGYYAAPSVVYSTAPAYDPPPAMAYSPPAAYGPPPTFAPPAPAYAPPLSQDIEPIQREVVFPSGRYVLRGDGINTPYTWVWIPNPPTAPPGGAPTAARDVERGVYTWTDADGVTTWTDRLSKVPPEYRATARRDL